MLDLENRSVPISKRLAPESLPGFDPPVKGTDVELDRVAKWLLEADPTGSRFAQVLRETYDQIYDGQRTGRWCVDQLHKTEKTHIGTIVEMNLHKEFGFEDGLTMDYLIDGVEVDCKFSQTIGNWEIPPEAFEARHLCLVVWADDFASRWYAGLVRPDQELLGRPNRDGKRRLLKEGTSTVSWLFSNAPLPENLLLHIDDNTRDAVFSAGGPRNSGQAKVNMLFRLVQQRLVNRASVFTVAQQDDSMKRARDARLHDHLGQEGLLVLGHQEHHPAIAEALGLPRPPKGSFISVRVAQADAEFDGPVAEIDSRRFRIADANDPAAPAPQIPRKSKSD